MNLSHIVLVSKKYNSDFVDITSTRGEIARLKATVSTNSRLVVSMARELVGGNGLFLEFHVMKCFMDLEASMSNNGSHDINLLVSGCELTGGISAFASRML